MESINCIIEYGVSGNYVDVTNKCISHCLHDNIIMIPQDDCARAIIFGDHIYMTLKHIRVSQNNRSIIYYNTDDVKININNIDISELMSQLEIARFKQLKYRILEDNADKLVKLIHSQIKFEGGSIRDEYPEQIMAAAFIQPHNKVLELGSNIGRNTLIIANLLNDQKHLVTLECNVNTCKLLQHNRDINKYNFYIEESALSYRKLVLNGWISTPIDSNECTSVNCITFQELEQKYNIQFDTLVADCEGALYYILLDYPDMLNNINTVIMENDYTDINHKLFVDSVLYVKGFKCVYIRAGGFNPCYSNFYETWSK